MAITLHELALAYRKAKVDYYYTSHNALGRLLEYESELDANLRALLACLNQDDESWVKLPNFVGGWTVATKRVKYDHANSGEAANGLIFSSPESEWAHICEQMEAKCSGAKPCAEFRVMADVSVNFHVLSALWLFRVGSQYDARLGDCAYGNRLRRAKSGKVNPLSLGSFKPYLTPFKQWRDNGLRAMSSALEEDKVVVAITADVSSFYHELNPDFLLEEGFNARFEFDLGEDDRKLHRLFISALISWSKATPLGKGLPVGLPASAVVANVALLELDQVVEQHVVPLYYGRYVDDIILVMENGSNFNSTTEIWEWLFDRAQGKLKWNDQQKTKVSFCPSYLQGSRVEFANGKNKIFVLRGATGKTLLASITRQIAERASEWRAMPNLPSEARHVSTDLVAATQSDGEIADNLRKADLLSMRRAGFAIKLRDFEAYERDLEPDAWQGHRHAFFDAIIQHVLVLPHFFDLEIYLPRVVKLATACADFAKLRQIIDALDQLIRKVELSCVSTLKSCDESDCPSHDEIVHRWRLRLCTAVDQAITAAFPVRLSRGEKAAWNASMADVALPLDTSISARKAQHARWFAHDLAHTPLRFVGLPREMITHRGVPSRKSLAVVSPPVSLEPTDAWFGVFDLCLSLGFPKNRAPIGFLFATRPFGLAELYLLPLDPLVRSNQPRISEIVLALRGFELAADLPFIDSKGILALDVPDRLPSPLPSQTVAVSSWKTDLASWTAAVVRSPDPKGLERYSRVTQLINGLLSDRSRPSYAIFPELSIPLRWFMRISQKLQGRGISLVAGVEYLHAGRSRVRHQVWTSLSHHSLGFRSAMIYRQDKQRPAFHEEQELYRVGGVKLVPEKRWTSPPVIQHGTFRFAILVCSELTNISYRASLRGEIDALVVPEWNPDIETFNSLVESAALDMHAYVVQCNDRSYGDSRIRAPAKESWQRDILRVKGGLTDYFVTGVIEIDALRRFQSSRRSPSAPYKPVPDGFTVAFGRKLLPTGK